MDGYVEDEQRKGRANAESIRGTGPVAVLEVDSLSKTFPGTRALIDMSLTVESSEVHGVIGQNGSGKSTLIKILAGFHPPDPGATVQVCGRPLTFGDGKAAAAAGLRFVHQDLGLVPTLDVVDNLALGTRYIRSTGGRIAWSKQRAATKHAIDVLGYEIDVRSPVSQLAPVERTAVAIARALWEIRESSAALLVLDEPTAAMPQPQVERLFEIIRRVQALGIAVLYISHHLEELFAISDRVTVMRDGRPVGTYRTADTDKHSLVQAMTGGIPDDPQVDRARIAGEPALEIQSLQGRRLKSLDLILRKGEVVGIAGITGSGREEVSRLVFGGYERTGRVTVEGQGIPPMRPDLSVKAGLAFVPADRHADALIMPMNVRENLTVPSVKEFWRRLRLAKGAERGACRALIQALKIKTPTEETEIASLSGGNQQKVVIARWLRLTPKVLLLDEPTQGIDVAAKAEVHRLVDQVAQEGTAVLVCSSDNEELRRLCDRVVVLRDGRAAGEIGRNDISDSRLTREMMGLSSTDQESGSQIA